MAERVNEMEWPSERIILAIGNGIEFVKSLRAALGGIRRYFSMPGPSDKFLSLGADKTPDDESKIDPISVELLARMAELGHDRFHTPYL